MPVIVFILALVLSGTAVEAAVLEYSEATIAAGEAGQIAVVLWTEGAEIAGVQNDIAMPPAIHVISDGGACYPNPAIGKNGTAFRMLWRTAGSERLRAIVLS